MLDDPDDVPPFGRHVTCAFHPCHAADTETIKVLSAENADLCTQVAELQDRILCLEARLARHEPGWWGAPS